MSPKGHSILKVGKGKDATEYKLRLGFSEIADADEFLGRSLTSAFQSDPGNFHILRTAFYFAARGQLKSVKEAGHVLGDLVRDGEDGITRISEALVGAFEAGGLISNGQSSEGDEGEA